MPPHENEHEKLEKMLKKNAELIEENNRILQKIHRYNVINMWLKVVWLGLIIGLPFILFYALEPYFSTVGASYQKLIESLNILMVN